MIRSIISLLFFALMSLASATAGDVLVQKGDTGTSLAQRFKVSLEVLQRANPEQDWQRLKVGVRLLVPERYTVKAGDTLYSLSRTWGVEQSAVVALNALSGSGSLKVGQVVFIPPAAKVRPSAGSAVTATPEPSPAAPSSGPFWPVEKTPRPENDKLKAVTFASTGENFRSVSTGTVVYLGEFRGVGRVMFVQSADKTVFAYGNFESSSVEFGQTIVRGQVLGATSPRNSQKLYFFAFRQTDPLDVFTTKR